MGADIILSKREARRLAVIHQGLNSIAPFGRGRKAIEKMMDRLGYIQIDTISVIERAHHHVIGTRVPGYRKKLLRDLQVKHRSVLEYWAHAAAYIPIEDYRFTIPIQEHFRTGSDGWPGAEKRVREFVYDRIRSEGPLMSRDFERVEDKKGNGWWDWKPAKLALQRLFFEGELMISHRQGFQRVYDLPERVLPSEVDTTPPTKQEYADYLIDRYLRAHGVGTAKSMSYLRKGMGRTVVERLRQRADSNELSSVKIKGVRSNYYSKTNLAEHLSTRISQTIKILSPFDNLVIQRERLSEIFDFDYQIECYVPSDKRVHGYFVLPILLGDKLVGRMDAKADRKRSKFNIKYLALEPKVNEDEFVSKFAPAVWEFARFNECDEVSVEMDLPFKAEILRG